MGNTTDKSGEQLTNLPEGRGIVITNKTSKPRSLPPIPVTSYTEEMGQFICGQIGEGNSLRSVLRDNEGMPAMSTVFKWLNDIKSFSEQYVRAKEESADALSDDIQDIAVKTLRGEYDPQASRVAIDAYKWTASKLKPKKYGDKIDHTTNGKDLPTPILGSLPVQNTPDDVLDLT